MSLNERCIMEIDKIITQLKNDFRKSLDTYSNDCSEVRLKLDYILDLIEPKQIAPKLFEKDRGGLFEELLNNHLNKDFRNDNLNYCIYKLLGCINEASLQETSWGVISKFFLNFKTGHGNSLDDQKKFANFLNFYNGIAQKSGFNWVKDAFTTHFDLIYKDSGLYFKNPTFLTALQEWESSLGKENILKEQINLFILKNYSEYDTWAKQNYLPMVQIKESELSVILDNGYLNKAYLQLNFKLDINHLKQILNYPHKTALDPKTVTQIISQLAQLEQGHTLVPLILGLPSGNHLKQHGDWIKAAIEKLKIDNSTPEAKVGKRAGLKV